MSKLGEVLHCEPHYFEKKDFLEERMKKSEEFLSFVVDSIQKWSHKLDAGGKNSHFLNHASYYTKRSESSFHPINSLDVLFIAVEKACLDHAMTNSNWWVSHAEVLVNSEEAVLRYIGLLCLIETPNNNIALAKQVLFKIQEDHAYSFEYETALLLRASSPYLFEEDLVALQKTICCLYEDIETDGNQGVLLWFLKNKRDILLEIPAMYRTIASQKIIDDANKIYGEPNRKPPLMSWGGFVFSPISSGQFLKFTDSSVLRILQHYDLQNYGRDQFMDDSGVGGPYEVAQEFAEAVSRDPSRFLLWGQGVWMEIAIIFREAILKGASRHAEYRFGNLVTPPQWEPVSTPDSKSLLSHILSIFDKCSFEGFRGNTLFSSLEACADLAVEKTDIECVCTYLNKYVSLLDSSLGDQDCQTDLDTALTSDRGTAARSAIVMANHWLENNNGEITSSLMELLWRFASDKHLAARSMLLIYLPCFIGKSQRIGWNLFDFCVSTMPMIDWKNAYRCLYCFYDQSFDHVQKYLLMMEEKAMPQAGRELGMLMTLSYLSRKISFSELKAVLERIDMESAWGGAGDVFSCNIANAEVQDKCLSGLEYLLKTAPPSHDISRAINKIFDGVDGRYQLFPELTSNLVYEKSQG